MIKIFNKLLKNKKAELETQIKSLIKSIDKAQELLSKVNIQIDQAKQEYRRCQNNLTETQHELGIANGLIEMEEIGIEYTPDLINQDQISQRKEQTQQSIAELISNDKAILTTREYRIDGSAAKGRQFQKTFCENLMIGFTSYFTKKQKSITSTNFNKSKELIVNKFNSMNRKASMMGVAISQQYLNACLTLLHLELDEKIARAEEKERVKEERRKLREQEKMLAEAEKARAELQKERRMYEQSMAHALSVQEREDFEAKLKEIDKREADVDYRVNNARAGYLYVTASKAMPGMTKIGVTRRLNPLVRIQELSTAGVPYPFICYGLVFCDDAFDLETRVHAYFDKKRVNVENKHKEFFYVSPKEAIDVLQKKFKCEVHFVNESEDEE